MKIGALLALTWALGAVAACGRAEEGAPAAAPRSAAAAPGVIVVPPDSAQSKQIRVQPLDEADVAENEVVAPGRVIIDPNRSSRLLLPVGGRIVSVLAKLGDAVQEGQTLVTIDSPDADAAVATYAQTQAAERQAQAAVNKTETDERRASELYGVKAIAEKDLLTAQNDLAQARGALEGTRAAREQARRKLELLGLKPGEFKQRTVVRAPKAGKVLEVTVSPGEYRNDTTASLMTIADLSTVWVSSDVPEPSIRFVRGGEPVTITLIAYPGETFTGRVARIADTLDPQSRTVKVHVELPNPQGRLRPEMFGTTRLAGTVRCQPVIPPAAVVQEYGRSVVFVERSPGHFERRNVKLGPRVGDLVAAVEGVQRGERVVVDGAILLKDR